MKLKKNKIFLFLGAPGSGKGTLSAMCSQYFGWQQLSTGNLCREHIAQGTPIGKQIQKILESGDLVSDDIIAGIVVEWILSQKELPQGIIFDGYPRTKNQAETLHSFLQEKLSQFELIVVKLAIDEQLLHDRIINRVICSNKDCGCVYSLSANSKSQPQKNMVCDKCGSVLIHRADDTESSLKHRLSVYYQHEQEMIDFYVDKGLCVHLLDGSQSGQEVFEDFKKLALHDYVC